MSELKVVKQSDVLWGHWFTEYYLKSEVDKVIKELEKEKEYTLEHTTEVINAQERELRHQKYKRCLAIASTCRLRTRWFGDNAFYKKEQWALQWHKRWLELAEKFKEAK